MVKRRWFGHEPEPPALSQDGFLMGLVNTKPFQQPTGKSDGKSNLAVSGGLFFDPGVGRQVAGKQRIVLADENGGLDAGLALCFVVAQGT